MCLEVVMMFIGYVVLVIMFNRNIFMAMRGTVAVAGSLVNRVIFSHDCNSVTMAVPIVHMFMRMRIIVGVGT